MPIENLADSYIDRCVSACNLYVDTYNRNMASEIATGICMPLGKEFKADRFKSMTGQEWLDEYEGVVRWKQINEVAKALGDMR